MTGTSAGAIKGVHNRRDYSAEGNPKWNGGISVHPLVNIYFDMIGRCHRPSHARYSSYGGRGISVCERWRQDFWMFVADMGPRPEGYVLDRIDNDGSYEPNNCRWTTYSVSARNRRTSGWERRTRNEKGQFV